MIRFNLKNLLNDRKMSQAELAKITGIRPSTICDLYHSNAKFIKLEHIEKICTALDCTVQELFVCPPDRRANEGTKFI